MAGGGGGQWIALLVATLDAQSIEEEEGGGRRVNRMGRAPTPRALSTSASPRGKGSRGGGCATARAEGGNASRLQSIRTTRSCLDRRGQS
ncbi:unnamed protein product, partial [Nesidiocoris tenuis]